jgi:pilus assembly protein Flp/PilA
MLAFARKLYRSRRGAASIEYGLICALIVLAMMAALIQVADVTTTMWDDVTNQVESASAG